MSKYPTIAVIVAGGSGARFGGDLPKQYQNLHGNPLILHALNTFLDHPFIDAVQVVIRKEDQAIFDRLIQPLVITEKMLVPAWGGKTRQDSVRKGLEIVGEYEPQTVFIHDAARPFITADLIDRLLDARKQATAIIPVLPVKDTIKRIGHDVVEATLHRAALATAQTPQVFDYAQIYALHTKASHHEYTDDAALVEEAGIKVIAVPGEERNIKITTAYDMKLAEAMWKL